MEVVIDSERLFSRLERIRQHWQANKDDLYSGADALCVPMGAAKEQEGVYSKASSIHLYLLNYEFPDSLILLTGSKLYFMATAKKNSYIETAAANNKNASIEIVTLLKSKEEDANREQFRVMFKAIKAAGNKLGTLLKLDAAGRFIQQWNEMVKGSGCELVDIARGLGMLLAVKDEVELDTCKKAAVLTNKVMKYGFVKEMEEVFEKELSITHEAFAQKIESIIFDPSKIDIKVSKDFIESCYLPIIQSGGVYDIRPSAQSNTDNLSSDVILCSIGARYKNYCGNVSRTYLIDPNTKIINTYNLLLSLYDKCLEKMVPGNSLKDVMDTARAYLTSKDASLISHLPKSLGFAIGLEFRDSSSLLNGSNTAVFQEGMVFNLSVGFQNVPLTDADKVKSVPSIQKLTQFSLLLSDTVCIQKDGVPDILTKISKNIEDITYNLNDKDEEEPEEGTFEDEAGLRRSARGKEEKAQAEQAATKRAMRQAELMEKKLAEAQRRLEAKEDKSDDVAPGDLAEDIKAYKSVDQFPKDAVPNKIKVDMEKEAVLVPISGALVPFHISTIKNVSMPEPDRATYLRINFYSPGQALGKDAPKNIQQLVAKYGDIAPFVKELTFRSLDPKNLTNAYRMILELRKRVRQREQQEEQERDLVVQDKLIRIKDQRVPRMQDITMRPQLSGRKSVGTLEAHQNGLRFTTSKGEIMDIMYANIKHAIFQPCEKSVMVLIHFHLKEFVMIGKKKQKDIQFFTEVIDSTLNLDGQRRSHYDPDELDDEQREREMKKKLNLAFKEFCKKVEKVAKHYDYNVEFDIPYLDLGFYGNCNKEMVFIQPSVRCLVNLTETPFFVVDLAEVEHVHFERMSFTTKNFDMAIIFKNFDILPRTITSIEMQYFDMIQDWLNGVEITYTAGAQSMNWKMIMDAVKDDPRFYFDTDEYGEKKPAGWNFLKAEDSDEEGEEEEDEDSVYEEASDESEEESEDSEEDDSEFADEDESSGYEDEDSEEEGESWDDLEREAMADDRAKRAREQEDDNYAPKKKGRR